MSSGDISVGEILGTAILILFGAGADELTSHWRKDAEWAPAVEASVRDRECHNRRRTVEKSFGWEEGDG